MSRTAAHDGWRLGTIRIPCFASKPSAAAIATDAQSVSGMNPTRTASSSGASEPAGPRRGAHGVGDEAHRGAARERGALAQELAAGAARGQSFFFVIGHFAAPVVVRPRVTSAR